MGQIQKLFWIRNSIALATLFTGSMVLGESCIAPPKIGIAGKQFTIYGDPTFLVGMSYYGALGASEDFIRRDLADMMGHGINWIRVWATWPAFDNDVSAVDKEGKARQPYLAKLRSLIVECGKRGMIVDVTLSRGNGMVGPPRLQGLEAHSRAVETIVTALKSEPNWYLDLANERDVQDKRFVSVAELKKMRQIVKKLDPSRLVTASHGSDLSREQLREDLEVIGLDFVSPHRPRTPESPGQTEAKSREYLRWMREIGRVVPLHYQEPFPRGYTKWQPSVQDFLTDVRGAKAGGAAGWCFHNTAERDRPEHRPRRSFDLREQRLFDQFDKEELKVLTGLRDLAADRALPKLIPVGLRKQLFVDDFIVDTIVDVKRELGKVTKANGGKPIFTDGWFYGTVLHDEGRFKLWYRKPASGGFGYAESTDGLVFAKHADLKGIPFAGDYTLAVEIDANEKDAKHRFMASYDAPGMAAGVAHSADGIHWTPYNGGKPVTQRAADTYNQVLWDPIARTYRLFTRTDFGTAGGATEIRGTRSMTNSDLKANPTNWKLVRAWIFDKEGKEEHKRRQVYATTCWIHEGIYFALLSVYEHPGDLSEGKITNTGKRHERDVMNFYIANSRDGDSWDLRWVYAGQTFVPRGPDGAFDQDIVLPASTIVTHADKHWIYYAGGNERHGTENVRFDRQHAIGLATLPLDRFVALTAAEKPGTVVSKPFKLEGAKVMINVEAPMGMIAIEVLDEAGKPIAGYSGVDAASAQRIDELRWSPRWNNNADLSPLRNQTIRIRFTMRNAKLYSCQIN